MSSPSLSSLLPLIDYNKISFPREHNRLTIFLTSKKIPDHWAGRHLREERDDGEPAVLGSVQRGRLQQGALQQPSLQVGDRAPCGPRRSSGSY